MTHPEYLYYAALALIVLPSAAFNRVAAVVGVVWLFEKRFFDLGVPPAYVDLVGDSVGLVFGLAYSFADFRPANRFAAMLFVPMMAIDIMDMRGMLGASGCYWLSYGLAMAQILALPGGNDWRRAKKTWDCYRKSSSVDWFFRVLARRHAL